jgi:hypothetical protein
MIPQDKLKALKIIIPKMIFLALSLILLNAFTSDTANKIRKFEAESAELIGETSKMVEKAASGGYIVSLIKPEDGIRFAGLPASGKLAIRYSSLGVGLISVAVNNQPIQKLNIHSSGNLTDSFLNAVIDITIPTRAMVTISLVTSDITVNIDQIIVGDGDLGLPPDIWNLPELVVAKGQYTADWKELSRLYTVPEWWREAKFGAWAHWDPQSMPEQGDWYARGMYMPGHKQYEYHLKNFGHPSEYGYKDICHNWVIDRWNPAELMDLFVEMGARSLLTSPGILLMLVPGRTLSAHGKRSHVSAV